MTFDPAYEKEYKLRRARKKLRNESTTVMLAAAGLFLPFQGFLYVHWGARTLVITASLLLSIGLFFVITETVIERSGE